MLLAVVGAAGAAAGWVARGEEEPRTTTATVTTARTTTAAAPGLPPAVERTRSALQRAAAARDLEALRREIPAHGFTYTFGEQVEGGAVAHWEELERTTDERPIETLARVLELPYTLRQGHYVWPFAYGTPRNELTRHERGLLGSLVDSYAGEDYYGWRAGIRPDGTFAFFVAGD